MTDLLNVSAKLADGRETTLSNYRGKVMLVVNVALKCGLTKQYDGLEKRCEDKRERGFVIAAFPAKGEDTHPLYQRLTTAGRSGKVVARFAPDITAEDQRLVSAIDGKLVRAG